MIDELTDNLFAVADHKAYQIETFLKEKKRNVVSLAYSSDLISALEKLKVAFYSKGLDSKEYRQVVQDCRAYLEYHQRSFGYKNLFLVSPSGDIVFSTTTLPGSASLYKLALYRKKYKKRRGKERPELVDVFIGVTKSLETEISNFEYDVENQEADVFIGVPVIKGPDLIGVLLTQMNNRGFFDFVQDYSALGDTGETILLAKIGDQTVFITPPRFHPDWEFKGKIDESSQEWQYIQEVIKAEGAITSADYRGKDVLTVRRYLPSFKINMILKMDKAEVLKPAVQLRNTLIKISLFLLIIVVALAVSIANSISKPIRELTKVSGIIAGGDLSARVNITTGDEIHELADSFNTMTDSLVEAKANVEQKKDELEAVNKELDSFVYTASHDLRAPLRGIDAFANLLESDYTDKLDAEGKDYLARIRSGVNRMTQLIDDLLTLSRISRIKNPYEDVPIKELIKSVVERIEFDIEKHKVELKIADNLPIVYCDRIKMAEVFLNLINNGIKFSSKNKEEKPRVEIGYTRKNGGHQFSVKDNGIGIDKQHHEQVFGIFKRLHKQEEYEGSGAGLGIVKKIIDDHNGRIWIESELGQGATFYFTLPDIPFEQRKYAADLENSEGKNEKEG